MTPFLTAKLAGQYVAVDAAGLFMSTLQVTFLVKHLFLLCSCGIIAKPRKKVMNLNVVRTSALLDTEQFRLLIETKHIF